MVTRTQKIRLGFFLLISVLALVVTILAIVAPKFLEKRDVYYVGFRDISVTGLQEGGSVKYQGLTVGYVSDIYIDPEDIRRVVVEMSLDHSTPIKTDTQADIAFLGITGLKLIELRGGSQDAESLQPGKFITPGRSVTDLITGRAEVIAEKTEVILNNIADLLQEKNRDKILALVDRTTTTFDELHDLIDKNNKALTSTIANAENISTDLQEITHTAKSSMFALDDLITSDSLRIAIGNLAEITETVKRADLIRLVQEMNVALERMNGMLREMDVSFTKSRTDLMYTVESMRESIDYLNLFARTISEDPSVLVRGTKPDNAPDFELEK